jgi:molybdopterin molybdotransferase
MSSRAATPHAKHKAEGKLLELEDAHAAILGGVQPLPDVETLEIGATLKRVLAEPLVSTIDVPDFDNSAMDGYALRSADLAGGATMELKVAQYIRAGGPHRPLQPGTAARIFTGAPLPEGADAVIMQEECERKGDSVHLQRVVRAGEHVRPRAHDIARGAPVLPAGHRMRPQDVAVAAATGTTHLRVRRRPRVAVFSTGNELALPPQALGAGQRYTANNHLLAALAQGAGAGVTDAGIVPDDLDATCDTLEHLARDHDLLLSSGGASVGDEDHVHRALGRVGEVGLWRISVRPGKPLIFGRIGANPFVGLPGNPVSVFVTFLLLVRPLILALQGATSLDTPKLEVSAGFDWPEPGARREFARVRVETGNEGGMVARLYPDQSSDILSSIVWADGLVEIPAGVTLVEGDRVGYLPFAGLLD